MKILTYRRNDDGSTTVTANHCLIEVSAQGATKAAARKALQRELRLRANAIYNAYNQIERDIEKEEA